MVSIFSIKPSWQTDGLGIRGPQNPSAHSAQDMGHFQPSSINRPAPVTPIGNSPIPFAKAASADAGLKEFGDRVASGEISPEAPFDGMTREWTKAETDGFHAALARIFDWK